MDGPTSSRGQVTVSCVVNLGCYLTVAAYFFGIGIFLPSFSFH